MRPWGWPSVLAALSLFGLLAALLGQNSFWWTLSWIALATPVGVLLCLISRPVLRPRKDRCIMKR